MRSAWWKGDKLGEMCNVAHGGKVISLVRCVKRSLVRVLWSTLFGQGARLTRQELIAQLVTKWRKPVNCPTQRMSEH